MLGSNLNACVLLLSKVYILYFLKVVNKQKYHKIYGPCMLDEATDE